MKAFKRILVLVICAFILAPVSFAKTTTTEATTTPSLIATKEVTTTATTVEKKSSREELVGNIVDVTEDLSQTSFAAGNIVTFKSKVDGMAFIAGNTLNISGQSDYSFVAGNNININGLKTKDLFVAGNIVTINEAELRDMYVAGSNVTITGSGNSVYVSGETVTLKGNFNNVTTSAETVIVEGTIAGTLKVNDDAELTDTNATINNIEKYENEYASISVDSKSAATAFASSVLVVTIISAIMKFIALLIAGVIFIAVCKKTTSAIEKSSNSFGYIAARFGIGFAALIIMPIISIILICTGVGALVGGIMLLMYVLLILLSSIASTLYFGKLAFAKLNNYVRFLLMAVILTVVKIIPILGGLAAFILLCIGIGVLLNALFSFRKEN